MASRTSLAAFAAAHVKQPGAAGVRHARALSLPMQDVTLFPLSCVHYPLHDRDKLNEWIARVKEKRGLAILLGDSFDWARGHLRRYVRAYQDDESSPEQIDDWHARDVADLARILEPIRGQILGVVRGNHYHLTLRGLDSEQLLARALNIAYLGVESAIRLDFTAPGKRDSLVVYAHHGDGGGRTWGGDLNAMMRSLEVVNPDIAVLGHTHKCYAIKPGRDYVTRDGPAEIRHQQRVIVRSGCMKSRSEEIPSREQAYIPNYRAVQAYPALAPAWVEVDVEFRPAGRRLWVRF